MDLLKEFLVDRENHLYKLRGERLDSVTEILVGLGILDPTYYTETGRVRGKRVHEATELIESPGGLKWESLKPIEDMLGEPITLFAKGWERFLRETGWKSTAIEEAGYHPLYKYAGTLDRRGRFPDDKLESILDIKTGKGIHKGTAIQTAGYDEMIPNPDGGPRRRWGILLPGNGDFKINPYKDLTDGATFISALPLYRWKMQMGLKFKFHGEAPDPAQNQKGD